MLKQTCNVRWEQKKTIEKLCLLKENMYMKNDSHYTFLSA